MFDNAKTNALRSRGFLRANNNVNNVWYTSQSVNFRDSSNELILSKIAHPADIASQYSDVSVIHSLMIAIVHFNKSVHPRNSN